MKRREYYATGWRQRLLAGGLASLADLLDPAAALPAGDWQALSKPGLGGRQRWRWRIAAAPGGGADTVLFVKRYARLPLRAQWDRITRQAGAHSAAWWEFDGSRRLHDKHIPAVRAVAAAEEMRGLFERRSIVVLEAAGGAPLDLFLRDALAGRAPWTRGAARLDLPRRLGRLVCAFHQTGQTHRDLYLCHIFIDWAPPLGPASRADAAPQFTLIDLARVHRPRWCRTRWFIKDLAQLDASARQVGATRTDRLRCLLAYLGLQRGAPRVRWWARRVVRKSDWILRRIARQARGA